MSERDWGFLADVMRRLSIGRRAALKLVDGGKIGVLRIDGLPDRFDLDDVERIYQSGLRPARAGSPEREPAGV